MREVSKKFWSVDYFTSPKAPVRFSVQTKRLDDYAQRFKLGLNIFGRTVL